MSTTTAKTSANSGWLAKKAEAFSGYLFLGPFLTAWAILMAWPLLKGLWISLHEWELLGGYRVFIGFENYFELMDDRSFWRSFRNTIYFVVITVPTTTCLSLMLALALNRTGRFLAFCRGVFFSTAVLSVTVVTLIWNQLYSPTDGLFAHLALSLGFEPLNPLQNKTMAMPALMITTVWWGIGFPMMLFLAGLQQIPQDIYEAAKLDNASPWRRLTRITLPALNRVTVLVIITQLIAHFQLFGQSKLMTNGGPSGTTRSLVQEIYENGFRDWRLGYASATAVVLLVIMFTASIVQLRLSRRDD